MPQKVVFEPWLERVAAQTLGSQKFTKDDDGCLFVELDGTTAVVRVDDGPFGQPRVVMTVEELGNPGAGYVAHLSAEHARRLRGAIHDALREIGQDPGR